MQEALLWQQFKEKCNLSDEQLSQFQQYARLLIEWNSKFNITTILDIHAIITTHFQDSVSMVSAIDSRSIRGIGDVGAGGGFPGLPIKIMLPDVFMVLIEVNQKKVQFLREVIAALGLTNIEVCDLDWRTFLRKTDYPIDLFCARASLSIPELLRVFKPNTLYADAQLVYWASRHYTPDAAHKPFVVREVSYTLGTTPRKLVFFKKPA